MVGQVVLVGPKPPGSLGRTGPSEVQASKNESHAKQGTGTHGLVARSPFAGYPSYPEPMEEGMPANGTIIQVIGSTFDAQFPEDQLPAIYNAVKCSVTVAGETSTLVGEVARHLGGGQVRCVALALHGWSPSG